MTGDAAIETESQAGDMVQGEGNTALGEGSIDMTEQSEEQKQKTEEQDRYDRIREKYNNDTDKIIKAYDEAQRKISELSTNIPQAPDNYEFDISGIDGVPEDFVLDDSDPLLAEMLPVFKENNITGQAAQALAEKFIQYEMANTPNPEQELGKLGAEKDEIIGRLTDFSHSRLTPEEQETFSSMTVTAEQTKLLHKLIALRGEQPAPDDVKGVPSRSPQELRDEAFEYKKKHSRTISGNKAQQQHYHNLLAEANAIESKQQS